MRYYLSHEIQKPIKLTIKINAVFSTFLAQLACSQNCDQSTATLRIQNKSSSPMLWWMLSDNHINFKFEP